MAAKRRPRKLSGLKSSFVVTFSAMASLAGCGDVRQAETPDTHAAGAGGASGQGGASGTAGNGGSGGFTVNPPRPMDTCPGAEPLDGSWCGDRVLICEYGAGATDDPCDDQQPVRASCANDFWAVEVLFSTCNPPPTGPTDAGFVDEDAGG